MPPFENFLDKVKSATKSAADKTGKAAKVYKLKMDVVTLNSEKNKHLQTIGLRVFTLYNENNAIEGNILKEKVKDEISQIIRIDERIKELEAEISDIQSGTEHVDVTDVTDDNDEEVEESSKEEK